MAVITYKDYRKPAHAGKEPADKSEEQEVSFTQGRIEDLRFKKALLEESIEDIVRRVYLGNAVPAAGPR